MNIQIQKPKNEVPDLGSEELTKAKDELEKLRAESKQIKHRLKQETDSRKNWQEISRKKDEELNMFREQVFKVTKDFQAEKEAHQKT